jgi:hypothetical protein
MFLEGNFDTVVGSLFNDNQVGNTADDDQIAGKCARNSQGVSLDRIARVEKSNQKHGCRYIAEQVAQDR